jgi:hypothetical protein
MKIITVHMTPAKAREILEKNTRNRKVRNTHVEWLAGQIRRGEWRHTSETIAIAPNGVLLDGQHRLLAICLSGISVWVTVSYDEPSDNYTVRDRGISRNLSDVTGISSNAMVLVSQYSLNSGYIGGKTLSSNQAIELYETHREAFDYIGDERPHISGLGRACAWAAIVGYYIRDTQKCKEFASSLKCYDGTIQQCMRLRACLMTESTGGRITAKRFYRKTIYCCKKHMAGSPVLNVREADWDDECSDK